MHTYEDTEKLLAKLVVERSRHMITHFSMSDATYEQVCDHIHPKHDSNNSIPAIHILYHEILYPHHANGSIITCHFDVYIHCSF